jgi:uncharacterized membrane protein
MAYYLKLYLATLAVFFAIDILWLGLVARTFYQRHLGFLLAPSPNWLAAILFYLLFVVGILVFVVVPGLKEGSIMATVLRAALFGLITYSAYDLTNQATVRDWPVIVTVVDMVWGTVLSSAVSLVSLKVGRWLA